MSTREPADYSAEFAARLRALGLTPVLIGGLAANVYRRDPRFTTDVDFLVERIDADLVARLVGDGFEVRAVGAGELPDAQPHVLMLRGHGMQVDLLRAETEYQREAMRRAVDGVLTAEDVVVHKLIADRSRDRDDVTSILSAGVDLDTAYVEEWAAAWGVLDRWLELRRLGTA